MIWVSFRSGDGLTSARHQAITWTKADKLSIGPLETNFREIRMEIQKLSFMKLHLNISSAKKAAIFPGWVGDWGWFISVHELPKSTWNIRPNETGHNIDGFVQHLHEAFEIIQGAIYSPG